MSASLFSVTVLWVVGLLQRRRWPRIPTTVGICIGMLLLQGWLLIANAQYLYDRAELRFVPLRPWVSGGWAPGAIDTMDCLPTMLNISGLLGILCVITDMAVAEVWRRRLLTTVLLTGIALTVYGLTQHILNQPLLLWDEAAMQHNLFATFYYHGNAGAFLNLLLPLAVAFVTETFSNRGAHGRRALSVVFLVLILAAQVEIASKAAMVVSGILLVSAGAISIRYCVEKKLVRFRRLSLQLVAVSVLALSGIALFGLQHAANRWAELPKLLHGPNARLSAWGVCLRMLPDAGAWGIGPANFMIAFPHYIKGLSMGPGVWEHAHQDYLETWIEWGWWGSAVWAVLIGGALVTAIKDGSSERRSDNQEDVLLNRFVGLSLAGLMLHALVDFPCQIPTIQLYAIVFTGILWSRRSRPPVSAGDGTSRC
ncbi:MAG TPA: O-antigen ligase family protein [Chthoniobacter sp.]|nr:O-antigen ligase family protein [Chthoniobacter sp.]